MSKIWLSWILVGVVVLGGGYLLLSNGGDNGKNEEMVDKAGPKSLRDLMAITNPQKCEVVYQDDNAEVNGFVYVASGLVRGDFETKSVGGTHGVHFILRDGFTHTWLDSFAMGFKAPISQTVAIESAPSANAVNLDQAYDYNCSPWVADQAVFVLPANINFTDTPAQS